MIPLPGAYSLNFGTGSIVEVKECDENKTAVFF
jgi:hypothetical protein